MALFALKTGVYHEFYAYRCTKWNMTMLDDKRCNKFWKMWKNKQFVCSSCRDGQTPGQAWRWCQRCGLPGGGLRCHREGILSDVCLCVCLVVCSEQLISNLPLLTKKKQPMQVSSTEFYIQILSGVCKLMFQTSVLM